MIFFLLSSLLLLIARKIAKLSDRIATIYRNALSCNCLKFYDQHKSGTAIHLEVFVSEKCEYDFWCYIQFIQLNLNWTDIFPYKYCKIQHYLLNIFFNFVVVVALFILLATFWIRRFFFFSSKQIATVANINTKHIVHSMYVHVDKQLFHRPACERAHQQTC